MTTGIEGIVAYELIDVTTPQAIEGLHRLIGKMGQMDLYFHSSGIGFQNMVLDEEKELGTIETNCLGMARLVARPVSLSLRIRQRLTLLTFLRSSWFLLLQP